MNIMKKLLYNLFLLPMLILMSACSVDEPLMFDHENAVNEPKEGLILLEAIMPKTTLSDDEIYIAGAFNGGDEAAVGNSTWQLERSTVTTGKWCIYLDPNDFAGGKTLADGYHFVSKMMGAEKTPLNEDVVRTDNPAPGTMTNLYVSTWEAMFEAPAVHTGHYIIYVEDKTSWGEALSVQDAGEQKIFGDFPGMAANGTERIVGRKYTYFDVPLKYTGAAVKLVFNNGDAKAAEYETVLNKNLYLTLTDSGVTEMESAASCNFWVSKQENWTELALYGWSNAGVSDADLFGGWPGRKSTGNTLEINGIVYEQIDIPEHIVGQEVNFIINNNGAGEQAGDVTFVAEAHDYFFIVKDKVATEVNPSSMIAEEPVVIPFGLSMIGNFNAWSTTEGTVTLVNEEGDLWAARNVHFEAADEFKFLVTDGSLMGALETNAGSSINANNPYPVYRPESGVAFTAGTYGINPGIGGTYDIVYDKEANAITVTMTAVDVTYTINVIDESGWDAMAVYIWGDMEVFGGWPGAALTQKKMIKGVEYLYVEVPSAAVGKTANIILNNNGAGAQFDAPNPFILDRDIYLKITSSGVTEVNPDEMAPVYGIHVINEIGWEGVSVYAWGDMEAFGGWAGAALSETRNVDGTDYLYTKIPADAVGKNVNLIFNNNGAGAQFDGPKVYLDHDIFVKVTESGVVNLSYGLYVIDETGWGSITVYTWGAVNDAFGGWPGASFNETKTRNGVEYLYYQMPVTVAGLNQNLIFNNNGGGIQHGDYNVDINKDIYVKVTSDGVTAIE